MKKGLISRADTLHQPASLRNTFGSPKVERATCFWGEETTAREKKKSKEKGSCCNTHPNIGPSRGFNNLWTSWGYKQKSCWTFSYTYYHEVHRNRCLRRGRNQGESTKIHPGGGLEEQKTDRFNNVGTKGEQSCILSKGAPDNPPGTE